MAYCRRGGLRDSHTEAYFPNHYIMLYWEGPSREQGPLCPSPIHNDSELRLCTVATYLNLRQRVGEGLSQGFASNQYKRALASVLQNDMCLYSDPEMQFLEAFEAVEYINKQLDGYDVEEDFDFLEDNCPDPAEGVTVELQ